MSTRTPIMDRWAGFESALRSMLRMVAAFLFVQHGAMKILAFPVSVMKSGGTVPLGTLPGTAGVLELVGGSLLFLGLFTRPVAFLLAGEMAVAYFIAHAPRGFWPTMNGGELPVLFCFIWLYFSAAGPGPWSLDALRSSRGQAK